MHQDCLAKSIAHSMVISFDIGAAAFGTTMERIPSFKLALTASWSTLVGKLKARWNSPTERSDIQYRWPEAVMATWPPAEALTTVVTGCASSSSTVGWWDSSAPSI